MNANATEFASRFFSSCFSFDARNDWNAHVPKNYVCVCMSSRFEMEILSIQNELNIRFNTLNLIAKRTTHFPKLM